MATKLTTSYQQIGYIVPIGSGTNNETRVHLYAKISSQNESGATIEARATIDLRYSGFSTSNGQLNLTGTTSGWSQTGSVTPSNYFVNGSWSLSRSQSSYAEVYAASKTMTRTNDNNEFSLGLHFRIVTSQGTFEASTGNVDLYFEPKAPPTYTISYNANGGNSVPANQIKQKDVELTLSSDIPSRGQSTDSTITIDFNGGGGSIFQSSLTSAVITSWNFSKWNTAAGGGGTDYSPGGKYTANENATLYAQWTPNVSGYSPIILPKGFRPGGYVLAGYSKTSGASSPDSGMTPNASWTPDQARTLYAVWTKQNVTLKICQELYDLMWPIGSVYSSSYSGDPHDLFGGTWEKYTPDPFEGVHMWQRIS